MSQYDVLKLLYNANQPLTKQKIASEVNVQPSTAGDTLRKLKRDDKVKCIRRNQFIFHPDATKEDLDKMEPMTFSLDLDAVSSTSD